MMTGDTIEQDRAVETTIDRFDTEGNVIGLWQDAAGRD